MTFAKVDVLQKLEIPMKYDDIPVDRKYVVREMYVLEQKGLCYHCKCPLHQPPPDFVTDIPITRDLFPDNFFKSPMHLHHSHVTGMTLGVVHNYCNAVLWEHHGE
jgi:hypothetical protein